MQLNTTAREAIDRVDPSLAGSRYDNTFTVSFYAAFSR